MNNLINKIVLFSISLLQLYSLTLASELILLLIAGETNIIAQSIAHCNLKSINHIRIKY